MRHDMTPRHATRWHADRPRLPVGDVPAYGRDARRAVLDARATCSAKVEQAATAATLLSVIDHGVHGRCQVGAVPKRCGRLAGMKTEPSAYRGFRFPAEIISHAVWLYHCFSLSLREVETDPGPARHRRELREHPRLGPAVRAGLRELAQATPAAAGRQVALG